MTIPPEVPDKSIPLEWLEDMKVLSLRPGDRLVIRAKCLLSEDALARITQVIDDLKGSGRVLVLEEGMDLGVVRKDA